MYLSNLVTRVTKTDYFGQPYEVDVPVKHASKTREQLWAEYREMWAQQPVIERGFCGVESRRVEQYFELQTMDV